MLCALDDSIRNIPVFVLFPAECAEQKTCGKEPDGAAGDVLFGDHPERVGVHDVPVGTAAVEVTAGLQRFSDGFRFVCRDVVILVKVPYCPAVGNKMPFESPFPAELVHQKFACAADLTVCAVIGAHNSLNTCIHKRSESREIGFLQIFRRGNGIKMMAESFRTAVNRKMLGAGGGF